VTPSHRRRDEINDEQAVNEEYLQRANRQRRNFLTRRRYISTPRNALWTASPRKSRGADIGSIEPLIGRVALDYDDPDLSASFYVGSWHTELDHTVVISWAAESAGLLFAGRDSSWHDPDPRRLLARRTFKHDGDVIVDFDNDIEAEAGQTTAFARQPRNLDIPPPPENRDPTSEPAASTEPTLAARGPQGDSPRPDKPTIRRAAPPSRRATENVPERPEKPIEPEPPTTESDSTGASAAPTPATDHLRARDLVMDTISEPRSNRLRSVLRTLQPDQHRLVTSPATEHLAVQGHPGTGKTIVATHRAAYLTHLEHDRNPIQTRVRLTSVGLVGPTDAWASYVRQVLDDLGAHGVEVISMQKLIRELSGRLDHPLHHKDERYFHSDAKNVALANETARRLKADLSRAEHRKRQMLIVAEDIINACRTDRSMADRLADEQHRTWLAKARNYAGTRRDKSYLLFLAGIGMSVDLCGNKGKYQHLIVDEVQDIRPAEWLILNALLRPGSRWSLFGDMNQRRADHTSGTWEHLLKDVLELDRSDGTELGHEVLATGYRSTAQILRYASGLLSPGHSNPVALRDGPQPSIRRVGPKQLIHTAHEEVEKLADEYPDGAVAMIAWDNNKLNELRSLCLKAGWRQAEGDPWALHHPPSGSRARLRLARPVFARGLEFDGVVVVEPADFQPNLGRHGSLYTALTRANQKLVVVHNRALPKELKRK
jgi:hypothetical protein